MAELVYLSGAAADAVAAYHAARLNNYPAEYRVDPVIAAAHRKFMNEEVFPVLAEVIALGPHETKEMPEPVCGIAEFQRLVGVS